MQKVISIKENKNNVIDKETAKKILKSEEDIRMGRTRKAREVFKEFEQKYGF